jgi:hypothetical protein
MVATKNVRPHILTISWALLICAALLLFAFPTRAQEKQEPPAAAAQTAPPKESNEATEAKKADALLKLPKDVGLEEIAGVVVDSQSNSQILTLDWLVWFVREPKGFDSRGSDQPDRSAASRARTS